MINQIIPSDFFNGDKTTDTYYLKIFYKNYVMQKEYYPYQFDGLYDKKHYGKLDNNGYTIYPKESYLKPYTNSIGVTHSNLSFVTDAFKDFKNYQNNLLKTNRINNNSIYSKLNVFESTDNVPDRYINYLKRLYDVFYNNFLNADLADSIEDINKFSFYFIKFVSILGKAFPINRSAFINSRLVPSSMNGLRISLDNPTYNGDVKLMTQKYIGDSEFDRFVDSAARFGFMVDRNFPWIIVADLESSVTREYAEKYDLYNTDEILETCYHKAYTADLDSLKNVFLSFWNSFAAAQGNAVKKNLLPNCKNLFNETVALKQLDLNTFEKIYNVNWQMRLYFFIKIIEEKININQNKFEQLFNESLMINKLSGGEKALEFINLKIAEYKKVLSTREEQLTSADAVLKLLQQQIKDLPTEGINF